MYASTIVCLWHISFRAGRLVLKSELHYIYWGAAPKENEGGYKC